VISGILYITNKYRVIHDLLTLRQEMIPTSLRSKNININRDIIIDDYGVRSGCNRCKRPPVNRASQVTLRDLEPVVTGTDGGSCNSQFSFTERQRELQSAVVFLKACLKHRSVQTEGIFMKLSEIYWVLCFFIIFLHLFSIIPTLHSQVQAAVTP
jgi:hypothetical protein